MWDIRKEDLWGWLGRKESILKNEINALIKEAWENSLALSVT